MTLSPEVPVAPPGSLRPRQMDSGALSLLSLSHLADDINQGALPVMLPFFIAEHNLSYSAAAALVLAVTFSSSILQPILGQIADRHPVPWLVPAGLVVAGGCMALSTLMPTYLLVLLAIAISGIGIAAFHPEAARLVNIAAGARQSTGMAIFAIGGNLGFAVGPLMATPLLVAFGLRGGLIVLLPSVVMALVMAARIPKTSARPRVERGASSQPRVGVNAWGPFARLTAVVISRSVVFYGLNTFIPFYWRDVLGQPISAGGVALTVLIGTGAVGTLAGGWLADRYGRRLVVIAAMAAVIPLLFALATIHDAAMATAVLVPLGLAMYATMGVMVVMGQEYLPTRIGTASGVTMGLGAGAGGFAAPFLGRVADSFGIQAVLNVLCFLPLFALAFAISLPRGKHHRAQA